MNAGKQAVWIFVALIGLAFSSWYAASSDPVAKLDDATLSNTADTIIQNLTVRQYNTEGQLVNFLSTPLLHHIPKDDAHWLKTPYIKVTQVGQTPWEIQAKEALSIHGGDEITLTRQVIIHQPKGQDTPESTMTTEEITYFPKEKIATTEKEVTFKQPGNVVQSKGMKAYLNEKRVQLLGHARGRYEPNHG